MFEHSLTRPWGTEEKGRMRKNWNGGRAGRGRERKRGIKSRGVSHCLLILMILVRALCAFLNMDIAPQCR